MINVLRATEEWQRAGAYSVRIQGMNRQHGISLREEFDDNDKDGTNYIVLLDGDYPIATCRFYETDKDTVLIGRVVVLPEYRGKQLGRRVIEEAEKWIKELGYGKININARVEAVGFYEKLGYNQVSGNIIKGNIFNCIEMEKHI
ncbi:MAG: GNAT family N-acetyltransferase [Eubacterium sp.]|nr:GNAT family N-acetyltransferase [Eubacterium sp.]